MKNKKERPKDGYWIIPLEIYNPLNKEFKFDFDPCPNPRPKDFDGLDVDWKRSNWVNPPFWAGITAWVRKAIAEQEKGKGSVLILPLDNWVKLLLDAGAEIRVVGSHEWIHTKDGTRRKAPRPSFLFILKSKNHSPEPKLLIEGKPVTKKEVMKLFEEDASKSRKSVPPKRTPNKSKGCGKRIKGVPFKCGDGKEDNALILCKDCRPDSWKPKNQELEKNG